MIFTKSAHRRVSAPGPISGKPVVPFVPNVGSPYYPNQNALFFTNLISGQTAYVEDSIAGRADFSYTGGLMGVHAEGEGYKLDNATVNGGDIDTSNLFTESYCVVFDVQLITVGTSLSSFLTGVANNTFFNWSAVSGGGFYQYPNTNLNELDDLGTHYVGVSHHRTAAAMTRVVFIDGVKKTPGSRNDTSSGNWRIGKSVWSPATNEFIIRGFWMWSEPYDGDPALTDQEMIDLTTDPWPYLASVA